MTDPFRHQRRVRIKVACMLSVALLLFSGCSSAKTSPTGASAPAATDTPKAPEQTVQPAPAKDEAGAPKEITISYATASGIFTPLFVAIDEGIFAKYGFKAEAQMLGSINEVKAQLAGEIFFSNAGTSEIINANVTGGDLVGLLTESYAPVFSIMVKPNIKSPQDLKGKTIGVTSAGTPTEMMAKMFSDKYKLDLKVVPTGGMPNILAALDKGVIDAGVISPPTNFRALESGLVELTTGAKEGFPLPTSMFTTTRSFMKKYPETTKKLVMAYLEGLEITRKQPDKAVAAIMKYTQQTKDLAQKTHAVFMTEWKVDYPLVKVEGVEAVLKASTNPKAAGADPRSFFDNSILEQLQKEKFIESLRK